MPASPERLQEIHEVTLKDPTLRLLTKIVHEGWPKMIRDCPHRVHSYTGISEMKLHAKMLSYTKESD